MALSAKQHMKFQSSLWKHMSSTCVVPLIDKNEYHHREQHIRALLTKIKAGRHLPDLPVGFLIAPKRNGVTRSVPVLGPQDLAAYFALVKEIDVQLSRKRVAGTFGGFQHGSARRQKDEEEARDLLSQAESFSASFSPCWPRAWAKNWQSHCTLLAARHVHASKNSRFVSMDISNFYDSIDLNRLETLIRGWCPTSKEAAINGLMMFLRTWNRGSSYAFAGKGIPMDLVGDASRVLANAYLVPFDAKVQRLCKRNGWTFHRFADDMVLVVGCARDEVRAIALVSEELQRMSLNLNAAKVECHSSDEFFAEWRFDIMSRLEQEDLCGAVRSLEHGADFKRRPMHLKRLLGIVTRTDTAAHLRMKVVEMVEKSCSKTELSSQQMINVLRFHPYPDRALDELAKAAFGSHFTLQLATLLQVISRLPNGLSAVCHNQAALLRKKVAAHKDPVLRFACAKLDANERAA